MLDHLTVVTHPLVQHKLTLMREKDTSTASVSASSCARSACFWPMRSRANCR